MSHRCHKNVRRVLSLLLSVALAAGNGDALLTAAAAELEYSAVEIAADELPEEEAAVELPEETAAPAEKAASPAQEKPKVTQTAPAKGTVTGFARSDELIELTVSAQNRPAESELVKKMPSTLSVYLKGVKAPLSIPVSWYCVTKDYPTGSQSYFQFSPKWDTKAYPLANGLDVETEAPCVGVFLTEGGGLSTLSVTKSSNESVIYRFLVKDMGLSCAAAVGIMANIQCESGFSPSVVGHGNATFYGLCQWGQGGSTGSRWSKLIKWCKSHGHNANSVMGQLMYMKHELETVKGYHYADLKKVANSAGGANKAAKLFAKYFEGCSSCYFGTRQRLAQKKYWSEYSPLALATVTLTTPDLAYDGNPQAPELLVTRGSKTLVPDKDYKVSFFNNINAGLASFELTGLGKYSGILLGTFIIRTNVPVLQDVKRVSNGIKVSWEPVAGAVRYRVCRKSGNGWVKVGDTAELSFVDTKPVSGEVNTYTVCCISSDGQPVSDYHAEGISLDYVASPVLNLSISNESVRIKWSRVKGASLYRIMKKNTNGEWEELLTTSSTSCADESVSVGKTVSYRAISLNAEEQPLSSYGVTKTFRAMPVPVLKKAKGICKGIQISWKKVPGAAKYRVFRKKGNKWVKIADTTSTSYKDKSVKKKKKYTYTVACISKDGKTVESGFSAKGVTGKRKK